MNCLPSQDDATRRLRSGSREPLLRVEALCVRYPVKQGLLRRKVGEVRALDGVDLRLLQGQTTLLAGEHGAGKTTLARGISGALPVASGRLLLEGRDLLAMRRAEQRAVRGWVQVLSDVDGAAQGLLSSVRTVLERKPKLLIFDAVLDDAAEEARAAIVSELRVAQDERGLTCLVLSRSLRLASLADDVAVLLAGRIVETGGGASILGRPHHPYTRHLASGAGASGAAGESSAPSAAASGCRFRERCPQVFARCSQEPGVFAVPGGTSRCFLHDPGSANA